MFVEVTGEKLVGGLSPSPSSSCIELTNILNNPKSNPPPIIERLLLKFQGYDLKQNMYYRKITFQTI